MSTPLDVEGLYRRHGAVVLRRAIQLLGDEQEARDAVQAIFLGLLERPDAFDGKSAVTTWLYAVTTRHCLNRIRNGKNRRRILLESILPMVRKTMPADAAELAELRALLHRLPPEEAMAAVLHYLDDMSHSEIAEVLGCSRRQVGYLLERIKQRVSKEERRVRLPA